mgnify:CR=1 FL=1
MCFHCSKNHLYSMWFCVFWMTRDKFGMTIACFPRLVHVFSWFYDGACTLEQKNISQVSRAQICMYYSNVSWKVTKNSFYYQKIERPVLATGTG